jgi:hypothetical protein
MNNLDSTLSSVRPNSAFADAAAARSSPPNLSTAPIWGPQMWALINKEMTLKDCTVFSYQPAEDPFDEDERAIWSLHYFFFNKALKRVCYLYVRDVPVMSHSPVLRPTSSRAATMELSSSAKRRGLGFEDMGANKRAKFWLGDRFAERITASDDELDDNDGLEWNRGADGGLRHSYDDYDDDGDFEEEPDEDDDVDTDDEQYSKSPVRGVSEDIASRMEIET